LGSRDIDGVVIGDGLSTRMVEDFLNVLAQEGHFRDIPVAVIGDVRAAVAGSLCNVHATPADPARLVPRLVPQVRLRAFESRLKRMLASLDTEGMVDPDTGLLTQDAFWSELARSIAEASERSQALSVARFIFEGTRDLRASLDAARLLPRIIRNIDFAVREDDGSLLVVFTQTDLRNAHVVARRIAAALKNRAFAGRPQEKISANVTLATLKAGDTLQSLLLRVFGSQVVAAE
ncbi:MAG TPA: GGDEF domain-containing protein, partial [Pseudolabrys sp.]|nr:GGDEF domain-containing protein [Pseudolabrys sp.]